jgi:hypothetical protein
MLVAFPGHTLRYLHYETKPLAARTGRAFLHCDRGSRQHSTRVEGAPRGLDPVFVQWCGRGEESSNIPVIAHFIASNDKAKFGDTIRAHAQPC